MMRHARIVIVLLLSAAGAPGSDMTAHSFTTRVARAIDYRYLLALPDGYDASPEKRWPLILFLHGAGERGDDVWLVAKHGPPRLRRGAPDLTEAEKAAGAILAEKFIVVAPQCPAGEIWNDAGVLALLDDVVQRLRVDATRLYLTGLSMGGYGTWSLASARPERFAAAVPICGGGSLISILIRRGPDRTALQRLPVWAFHGAKDPTVPLAESQRMVDALKRIGAAQVEFTVYPEATHNSWTETYAKAELYDWLLRHRIDAP